PAELLDEARHLVRVGWFALDEEVVPLRADADIQEAFEVPQVVVERPEQGGQAVLGDGNAAGCSGSDRDISLCCKGSIDQPERTIGSGRRQGPERRRLRQRGTR